MRVVELWTRSPMKLGPGGNRMPSHLSEVPRTGAPQEWLREPGKHGIACMAVMMEATPMGVVVSVEGMDGVVERWLVADVLNARLADERPPMPVTGARRR